MNVLSVKFNKRDDMGYKSYIITVPMIEGISNYAFLAPNEFDTLNTLKNGNYVADYGSVVEVSETNAKFKRANDSIRKIFFARPLVVEEIEDLKNNKTICAKICIDIKQYMCITNLDLGFQHMEVRWNSQNYPYLLLNNKLSVDLITSTPVSKDGIGIEMCTFKNGYTVDAYAPEIVKKRTLRDNENDTGTPTPL
jgi:hypothetical protein